MLHPARSDQQVTKEADDVLFWLSLEDDTEDAPWMVMGDLQFRSASSLYYGLRNHAREQGLAWYVASMLPIQVAKLPSRRKQILAPDLFVALVPERSRAAFDVAAEGGFPPFVLEVVSPSSVQRDFDDKLEAYEKLGAREYALFTPRADTPSVLQGYRRNAAGQFEVWPLDPEGRLWSDVLGLYLVVRGTILQAQTREGRLLRTPEQAEDEIQRLRRELERRQGQQE
jgi:hypothetical protein